MCGFPISMERCSTNLRSSGHTIKSCVLLALTVHPQIGASGPGNSLSYLECPLVREKTAKYITPIH